MPNRFRGAERGFRPPFGGQAGATSRAPPPLPQALSASSPLRGARDNFLLLTGLSRRVPDAAFCPTASLPLVLEHKITDDAETLAAWPCNKHYFGYGFDVDL